MPAIIKNLPRILPINHGNRGIDFPIQDSCNNLRALLNPDCKLIEESLQEEIDILMQDGKNVVVCDSEVNPDNPFKPCLADTVGKLYSLVLESDIAMTLGQQENGDDILVVS